MGKRKCIIDVQGKASRWGIPCELSDAAINDMREDGLDVGILENTIPVWVVQAGLIRPWCFLQDIWNFKNPLAK